MQRKSHEECFRKIIGVTDLENFHFNAPATSRSFLSYSFGDIKPVQSNVDSHVRLENRRIILPC